MKFAKNDVVSFIPKKLDPYGDAIDKADNLDTTINMPMTIISAIGIANDTMPYIIEHKFGWNMVSRLHDLCCKWIAIDEIVKRYKNYPSATDLPMPEQEAKVLHAELGSKINAIKSLSIDKKYLYASEEDLELAEVKIPSINPIEESVEKIPVNISEERKTKNQKRPNRLN